MAGMLEYKCPCCDGAIQFDSATQKMKCPYCDTEFDVDTLKGYDEELKDEKPSEMNWATPGGSWAEGETAGLHTYSYSFHKSYSYQLCAIEYDGSFSEQPPLHFVFTSEMWVFVQYRKSIETLSNSKTLANLLLVICAAIEIGLLYFFGIVSGKPIPFKL